MTISSSKPAGIIGTIVHAIQQCAKMQSCVEQFH